MTLEERRQKFRSEYLSPSYSGVRHILLTAGLCSSAVALPSVFVREFALELIGVFLFSLLLSNFLEYVSHRFYQHKKIPGFGLLYKVHTVEHHQVFKKENMRRDSVQDTAMVLFPVSVVAFLLLVWIPSFSLLVYFAFGRDVALVFYSTSSLHYLLYEFIHFASHHSEDSLYYRLPVLGGLCRSHQEHHDLTKMSQKNFGVVFGLWDRVFGTKA